MRQLFDAMKANTEERKRIFLIVEELNNVIQDAENKKVKAEKKINPAYNKVDLIDKGIKELERKLTTTSTDGKQEKQLIKEMQFIRDSRPFIEEVTLLKDLIFKKKKEKYDVSVPIQALKEEQKALQTKIDAFKKSQDQAKESKEQIQKALDKINSDRNALRQGIEELRAQKVKLREDFYTKLLAYERQQIEIRDIEWMTSVKERVVEREERRKEWEAEKQKRQEERQKKIEENQKREEVRRQK